MTPRSSPRFDADGHNPAVVEWYGRTAGGHGVTEGKARFVVDRATQYDEKRGKPGQPAVMWMVWGRGPSKGERPGTILEVGVVPEWPKGVDAQSSDPLLYRIVHAMEARSPWRERVLMREQGHL